MANQSRVSVKKSFQALKNFRHAAIRPLLESVIVTHEIMDVHMYVKTKTVEKNKEKGSKLAFRIAKREGTKVIVVV